MFAETEIDPSGLNLALADLQRTQKEWRDTGGRQRGPGTVGKETQCHRRSRLLVQTEQERSKGASDGCDDSAKVSVFSCYISVSPRFHHLQRR